MLDADRRVVTAADPVPVMTDAEYEEFLKASEQRRYSNHATRDSNGNVIDVDDYILAGMKILADCAVEG